MPFPKEMLNHNEDVVLDLRPHWWYFARPLGLLATAMALGIVMLAWDGAPNLLNLVAGVGVVVALGWFGLSYLRWATTSFVITTDRLISRSGVLSRTGVEIPLEKINTVFFRQTLFERIIKSGDLEIESASEQGTQDFSDIRRPLNVQNEIYRQMENNENRKFDRVGDSIRGQMGSPQTSIPDQIAQLDQLRSQGILTDKEFEAKKAELLRRL
ncbi:MAG: PH domain-containing protein [Acidimicrobiales bacterium]|nr:PH domain-containing protein [Acidimicrobiales bacterium]